MRYRIVLSSTFFVPVVFVASVVSATELVIFDDELHFGNLFDEDRQGAMTSFEVRDTNPHKGQAHLARDFNAGEWAWVNGIENMQIDLLESGLDFDNSFVEFYIDSGPVPVGYMELRLANQQWSVSDQQFNIQTDDVEGYEQVKIMLSDFQRRGAGEFPESWDDFTTGGALLDRISWGFGPNTDLTLLIDSIRIADQDVEAFPGDFNGDGMLGLPDVTQLVTEIAGGMNNVALDLNGDAKIDPTDLQIWVKDLKRTWIGDANLDGQFNSTDFVLVFQAGKFERDVEANWNEGDWTGDLRFGTGDFVAAFQDGGFEQGPRVAVGVPEPCSTALAWLGLAVLVQRPRRSLKGIDNDRPR